MKLYEVNQCIEELIAKLEPDPETGEVTDSAGVLEQLHSLQLERSRILEYLAKLVLNCRSEAESLHTEERRLFARRQALERKEVQLMEILDRECAGQKTDCGVATVSYRSTSHVSITDDKKALNWLRRHGHRDCIRIRDPEISKAEVRKLLSGGEKIPGLALVQELSCSLK